MKGYKTVKEQCSAEIVVKRSRFIATVCPCKTESEAMEFINSLKKKYWDATHNVYAFVVRDNNTKRFSDDGEPHSTAGLPTMETVEHFGVTDVAVVVTRYFGGVLLGTGGLVRAYSDATSEALKKAEILTFLPAKSFDVKLDYSDYDILSKTFLAAGAKITDTRFADKVELSAVIPLECFDTLSEKCTDIFCGRISFCNIEDVFSGF